jgi:hypothetical protein
MSDAAKRGRSRSPKRTTEEARLAKLKYNLGRKQKLLKKPSAQSENNEPSLLPAPAVLVSLGLKMSLKAKASLNGS